ncbi:NADH dehydrogenase [ubiquinone] iron-sulfur protein 5-B [Brassica rapa]|uniref:NADH dehydrogenase [ubiquinone] iron-sulfur protein 5-B n=1 Tax=Brassica campestris TaxID=3711 RepID=M4CJQ3_BRACM|nr:NADH dehydrogenase [ubiquinone] iron-sulfur protein 5-B [Brassica rapa]
MASGWGITGNKGRCYDFWMDFSQCMSHCREPKDCSLLREDYLECLHHSKEFQRRNRIYKEEQRKLRAASRKGEQVVDATHTHHWSPIFLQVCFFIPIPDKKNKSKILHLV